MNGNHEYICFFYVYHRLIILGYITVHGCTNPDTRRRERIPCPRGFTRAWHLSCPIEIYDLGTACCPSDRSTPARRHLFSHDCCSRERQSPHLLFRFRAARPITRIHTLMNVTRARDNWDQSYPMPVQIRTGMASFCFRRSVDPPTYGILLFLTYCRSATRWDISFSTGGRIHSPVGYILF